MQQYEVLSTIATALFGRVDRCRHRATGEVVAVKRMELSLAGRRSSSSSSSGAAVGQEDVIAELSTNLKLQALGGHPFVLSMKDCFMEQEAVQLVTAYCARGELLGVINKNRAALSVTHMLRYFKQTLLAMEFLHANGIAHRDVSLENVLVDEHDCCQVCDFGLATSAPTMRASPVGKAHYMAPEACATGDDSEAMYSPITADVWSLGVMLFSMVAGRYPFREPMRRDDHFRLLEDFGVAYLLAKFDVDMESNPTVADLLAQLFVVDPANRPSVATILKHDALAGIDCERVVASGSDNQDEYRDSLVVEKIPPNLNSEPASAPSVNKKLSARALITPLVSSVHSTPKASKENEVLQAELPESSRPTPSRREVINRAMHKIFRKLRNSDVGQ
ncbi:Camk/camkl protein kinase [Globisporangium polare]